MSRSFAAAFPGSPSTRNARFLARLGSLEAYRVCVSLGLTMYVFQRGAEALVAGSTSRGIVAVSCALLGGPLAWSAGKPIAALAVCIGGFFFRSTIIVPTVDDYFANLTPLMVAMVYATESPIRNKKQALALGSLLVPAMVLGIYIAGGPFALLVDSARDPAWIRWSFRIVAVALVAPTTTLSNAGVILQVLLHAYLFVTGHHGFVHIVLGASAILFLWLRTNSEWFVRVDLASVVGLALVVITLNTYVGWLLEQDTTRSVRFLSAVGVLPLPSSGSSAPQRRSEENVADLDSSMMTHHGRSER